MRERRRRRAGHAAAVESLVRRAAAARRRSGPRASLRDKKIAPGSVRGRGDHSRRWVRPSSMRTTVRRVVFPASRRRRRGSRRGSRARCRGRGPILGGGGRRRSRRGRGRRALISRRGRGRRTRVPSGGPGAPDVRGRGPLVSGRGRRLRASSIRRGNGTLVARRRRDLPGLEGARPAGERTDVRLVARRRHGPAAIDPFDHALRRGRVRSRSPGFPGCAAEAARAGRSRCVAARRPGSLPPRLGVRARRGASRLRSRSGAAGRGARGPAPVGRAAVGPRARPRRRRAGTGADGRRKRAAFGDPGSGAAGAPTRGPPRFGTGRAAGSPEGSSRKARRAGDRAARGSGREAFGAGPFQAPCRGIDPGELPVLQDAHRRRRERRLPAEERSQRRGPLGRALPGDRGRRRPDVRPERRHGRTAAGDHRGAKTIRRDRDPRAEAGRDGRSGKDRSMIEP